MKKQLLIGFLLMETLAAGRAGIIYYQGTAINGGTDMGAVQNQTIEDGNPANLTVNAMTLSGLGSSVADLTVTLNLTGGRNNGLFAYLVNGSTTVPLMNQPGVANGFGATGAGMNITLQDGAANSIQNETSGSALIGTYQAAGSLADFDGGNPNGTWTLYFADTIAGGGAATLNGWSLDITAVPEPVNVALGFFGGVVGLIMLARSQPVKRLLVGKLKSGKMANESKEGQS
jgi:hypothetical protein